MPEQSEELAVQYEDCGFCKNGVYFVAPHRLIECPYCDGTGKQVPLTGSPDPVRGPAGSPSGSGSAGEASTSGSMPAQDHPSGRTEQAGEGDRG